MSIMMTEVEFRTWEARQPLRFELVDGRPVRLADEDQGQSRLARVRRTASQILADEDLVRTWVATPLDSLGGLEPDAVAAESEDGCQLVLRALVMSSRQRDVPLVDIVSAVRAGPFIVFKNAEGMRHAVRHGAVLASSETDDDLTTLQMIGSRSALVRQTFDKVLVWFR